MKPMIKLAGSSLAVMSLGLAAAALAHPPQGGGDSPRGGDRGDRFERADLDGDGVITAQEREAARANLFDTLDTDGNGAITDAEMQAAHEARRAEQEERRARMRERMQERFADRAQERKAAIDTNSDGVISRAEFLDHESMLTGQLDANGDGDITREEADAAREAMHKARRGRWKDRTGESAE